VTAAEPPALPPAILYVDTSAMLKLLVREAESAAIEEELLKWGELATSVVAEVELPRAVARAREERPDAVIDGSVVLQGVLASAAIIPLDAEIVAVARSVKPVHIGALDAIHIASALSLGAQLAGVATYDKRMQGALDRESIRVIAPTPATDNQSLTQTPSSTSDDITPRP